MNFWTQLTSLVLSSFFSLIPRALRWKAASFMAWLWFDVLRLRRFSILKNLSIAFPQMPKEKKYFLARESLRHLCYNFFEVLLMPKMDQSFFKKNVTVYNYEKYEAAHKQDKGVLLFSLHIGNGDVGTAMLVRAGLKVNLISKKFKNRFLNDLWFGVREKMGSRFIDPHSPNNAFDILKALRRKECVIFVIDQFMGPPFGVETTFFGRKTGTAYGLALFAVKTQAPVLPVYTYRDKDFHVHIVFGDIISNEEIADRDLQIRAMTQKYNNKVEEIVSEHPEQWMWVHRRWKHFS